MAVRIDVQYEGDLHCRVTHTPSGNHFPTDAPVDNRGKGTFISPTDLVAAAMGSCPLTIMGIAARDRGIDLSGARASVIKEMSPVPRRHISKLTVEITLPSHLDAKQRQLMEAAARTCPVAASLGPSTQIDYTFLYE
jgi:putative redox protein